MNIARLSKGLVLCITVGLLAFSVGSAKGQSGNYNGFEWTVVNSFEPDYVEIIEGYTGPGGTVAIPSSIPYYYGESLLVTSIAPFAFNGCTSLTSVTIPSSVTSIGEFAFSSCTGLTSVTIPSSVTSVGQNAFIDCTSLTSVTMSNGLTTLADDEFYDCTSLTSVTIPSSVTSIGSNPFGGCTSLTAISVNPSNPAYASIAGVLFNESLSTLIQYPAGKAANSYTIPNSVTSIESGAFWSCDSLTSVTIPSSINSIESYAFYDCTSLTNACFEGNEPSDGGSIFTNDPVSTIYYVTGTTGWGSTYDGIQTAPCAQCGNPSYVYCSCGTNPISGATIQVGSYSATTDANGAYFLGNVAVGNYTAIIGAVGYALLTTNVTVLEGAPGLTNNFYLTNSTLAIHPIFDQTITNDAKANEITNSIMSAIQAIDGYIANPICVAILFVKTNGGLGASQPYTNGLNYSQYLSDLQGNQNLSANDITALASLPAGPTNPVNGNAVIAITTPLLRAIGEGGLGNVGTNADGTIWLNTAMMNLSRTGPQNSSNYDLQAVAGHEIDEVLGIGGEGSTLALSGPYTGQASPAGGIGPLDLFRYNASNSRSFTLNPNASPSYFSIDRGNTTNVHFNQLGWTSKGAADFGDWGNPNSPGSGNVPPQVQDAFDTPGMNINLGSNELIALDVVGYTLMTAIPTIQPLTYTTNTVAVNWTSVPGQTYQVQYATTLNGNHWNNLGSSIIATGMTASTSDTNATGSARFYRVINLSQSSSPAISFPQAQPAVLSYTPSPTADVIHYFLPARP
jgi:hypothetical protein